MLKNAYYSILFTCFHQDSNLRPPAPVNLAVYLSSSPNLKIAMPFFDKLTCDVVAERIEWGYLVGLIPDFLVRTFF